MKKTLQWCGGKVEILQWFGGSEETLQWFGGSGQISCGWGEETLKFLIE